MSSHSFLAASLRSLSKRVARLEEAFNRVEMPLPDKFLHDAAGSDKNEQDTASNDVVNSIALDKHTPSIFDALAEIQNAHAEHMALASKELSSCADLQKDLQKSTDAIAEKMDAIAERLSAQEADLQEVTDAMAKRSRAPSAMAFDTEDTQPPGKPLKHSKKKRRRRGKHAHDDSIQTVSVQDNKDNRSQTSNVETIMEAVRVEHIIDVPVLQGMTPAIVVDTPEFSPQFEFKELCFALRNMKLKGFVGEIRMLFDLYESAEPNHDKRTEKVLSLFEKARLCKDLESQLSHFDNLMMEALMNDNDLEDHMEDEVAPLCDLCVWLMKPDAG